MCALPWLWLCPLYTSTDMRAPCRNMQSGVLMCCRTRGAEAKYHEAQRAYETLSDKDKRQMYDQVTQGHVP